MMRALVTLLPVAAFVPLGAGCVQVSTGHYTIRGHDVGSLVERQAGGGPIEIGSTTAVEVRRKFGHPLVRYENNTTDIYEGVPQYRWIFSPWPVVLVNQKRPGDPRVLARVDYDAGVVRRVDTTTSAGPPVRGAVPAVVDEAWPDLRDRKPVAFGTK